MISNKYVLFLIIISFDLVAPKFEYALPDLVERLAARPAHHPADRHVGDLEAGAEDDRVDLALLAVAGDDRVAP